MIKLHAEPWRKFIRVEMSGLLTIEEVEVFIRDLRGAIAAMNAGPDGYVLLVQTQGGTVQRQDVMERFQHLIAEPQVRARRIAIVRQGVLGRMQARRLTTLRSGTEVFEDLDEAQLWLRAA